jgi:hypothetical protein
MGFPAPDRREGSPPKGEGQGGGRLVHDKKACGASEIIRSPLGLVAEGAQRL